MVISTERALCPIDRIKSVLMYDLQKVSGAMCHPFAAPAVIQQLHLATQYLHSISSPKRRIELLIWDAYRARATQQAIYELFVHDIMRERGLGYEDAYPMAREYVSAPTGVFPHGTGGAVDVTLLINDQIADMGTDFDAFIPEAASDWFRLNVPKTHQQQQIAAHREILRTAMENSGFVGLDNEWWHFEWGTMRWAEANEQSPVLDCVLTPPEMGSAATPALQLPDRQPVWQMGAAQVFSNPSKRSGALLHTKPGHYYARSTHPTLSALGDFIANQLVDCEHVCFTSSGLAACGTVLQSVVPTGGTLLYDQCIYYEVEREILEIASDRNWRTLRADFLDLSDLEAVSCDAGQIDAVFCDNPRNWWLDGLDITAIATRAHQSGAVLVVDTSVQPLQNILKQGADIIVCSLSKYPSLSLTLGGAILCNNLSLAKRVQHTIERAGNVLSPDAAATIWTQIVSLRDRLDSVSRKASQIAIGLSNLKAVRGVRIPEARLCGGLVGGQITFQVDSFEVGVHAERVIGHNSTRNRACLHLACTFGAAFTTFEHFASNVRLRAGIPREASNEIRIPDDMIRIGVGCEAGEDIMQELEFVLENAYSHFVLQATGHILTP